jgi:hypothetical protein
MIGSTHKAVGAATAAGVCAALTAPLGGAAVILLAAVRSSTWPDRVEKCPARMMRLLPAFARTKLVARFPWLRIGHRTWTHYVCTAIAHAVIVGAAILAAGVLVGVLLLEGEGRSVLIRGAAGMAVLVGIGVACGATSHTAADSLTHHGSPLAGPWRREPMHLLPEPLRITTGGPVDCALRWLATLATLGFFVVGYS